MNARTSARWLLLALTIASGAAHTAQAHFLFARILPPAEAGRAVEVYFSEYANAGDPRYIDKVAATQLWAQTEPGKFKPLEVSKQADRLRARVPLSGSLGVIGQLDYGVLTRPLQPAFLLRHYPKAVAGKPDDLNALKPRSETRFEIVPNFEADRVLLTLLLDGKPLPNTTLKSVDVNLVEEEFKTDDAGRLVFTPPSTGVYCVYAQHVDKTAGKHADKNYDEIREFATLSFTWPLVRNDADPEAVKLFQEAITQRAQWNKFPGFTAQVTADVDGRSLSGKVTVSAKGEVEIDAGDEPVAEWVRDQLASITMHRAADSSASDDKPVLRFADDVTDHPLGRLLEFDGGQFASSYRVRDKQLLVVNRNFGKQDMTITVLDNQPNAEGKFLPRAYSVQYWDAETGKLARVESVQERWTRVGAFDLPLSHTLSTANSGGLAVKTFSLKGHKLLDAK
jgi:hypothetical protein